MGLSQSQAVSAAKLIKQARKSGRLGKKGEAHQGTILLAEQRTVQERRSGNDIQRKNGLSTSFAASGDWEYSFDAGLLVDGLRTALLALYRQGIIEGEKPDGSGAQPALTERAKNQKGRTGKTRGYKTGYLADNLRASKITGSTTKATSRIVPPTNRNVFIASELKRGNSFFTVSGIAALVIADVTDAFIAAGLVNQNRAPDLGEKDSKKT